MFKQKLPLMIVLGISLIAFAGCSTDQTVKTTSTSTTTSATSTAPTSADYLAMTSRQLVDQCTTDMATQFHIHSHLTIIANKQNVEVPAEIGIDMDKNCMSSVHTHDTSGIIHVEAPVQKDFTLGDFFYNWKQPLTSTQFITYPLDSTHGLKVYVDQKEVSSPESIVLKDHEDIFIDYYNLSAGPDAVPAPYVWPAGYDQD